MIATISPKRSGDAGANRVSVDILATISDIEPTLSRTNRKIAHAILTEPRTFVAKPIEDLVGWVGVSAPTITRFARAVHCDGLRDLKLKIMGSTHVTTRYLESPTLPVALHEAADRMLQRAHRSLVGLHKHLDLAVAEKAIGAINSCRTLYAFGSGGVSSWLIEEVQNRFFRLGLRVIPSADYQMQMMLAATMERGDVLLAIPQRQKPGTIARARHRPGVWSNHDCLGCRRIRGCQRCRFACACACS